MNTASAQTAKAVETAKAQALAAIDAEAARKTLLAMGPPPVHTREYKERQWLGYWASVYGEYSEPLDGHEKKLWWRKTFGEEYVPSPLVIASARAPLPTPGLDSCLVCGNPAEDDLPFCSLQCECHYKYQEDEEWQQAKKAQEQSKGH